MRGRTAESRSRCPTRTTAIEAADSLASGGRSSDEKRNNEKERRSLAVLAITVARDSGEQGPGENVRVGCRAVLTCEGQVADRREMEKDYHQDYHPKTSRDEKR